MACGPADPVEEQQPGGVVDLVLHGDRPRRRRSRCSTPSPVPGSWPRTTSRRARLHVAGEVGHRHAALAAALSPRLALTTSALHSTNGPWQVRVFGCPETSTQNTRAPTPTCWAASPTHPGETRMVATRSAASSTVAGRSGRPRPPASASTGCGRAHHRQDASRPAGPASPQLVGMTLTARRRRRRERWTSTPSSAAAAGQVALQRDGGVPVGDSCELGDQHVEVAAQPGAEVDDVAAVPRHDPRSPPRRCRGGRAPCTAQRVRRTDGCRAPWTRPARGPLTTRRAAGGQRLQRRLDRRGVGDRRGPDDHREVAAQQRHRGVLEVAAQAGERPS